MFAVRNLCAILASAPVHDAPLEHGLMDLGRWICRRQNGQLQLLILPDSPSDRYVLRDLQVSAFSGGHGEAVDLVTGMRGPVKFRTGSEGGVLAFDGSVQGALLIGLSRGGPTEVP